MKKFIFFMVLTALLAICLTSCGSELDYCKKGEFGKAYKKADTLEAKDIVLATSVIAELCPRLSSEIDEDEFQLSRAYYKPWLNDKSELGQYAVICISNNGGRKEYQVFARGPANEDWVYFGEIYTTELSSLDNATTIAAKVVLLSVLDDGLEIPTSFLEAVNYLLEEDEIYHIQPIDQSDIETEHFEELYGGDDDDGDSNGKDTSVAKKETAKQTEKVADEVRTPDTDSDEYYIETDKENYYD